MTQRSAGTITKWDEIKLLYSAYVTMRACKYCYSKLCNLQVVFCLHICKNISSFPANLRLGSSKIEKRNPFRGFRPRLTFFTLNNCLKPRRVLCDGKGMSARTLRRSEISRSFEMKMVSIGQPVSLFVRAFRLHGYNNVVHDEQFVVYDWHFGVFNWVSTQKVTVISNFTIN